MSAFAGDEGPTGPAGSTGAPGLASRVVPFFFDPYIDLAVGDAQAFFFIPADMDGWLLTDADAGINTPGTGTLTVQVRNVTAAVDMLAQVITIETGEAHTSTATNQPDPNPVNAEVNWADKVVIDIDAVPTNGRGLQVNLTFSAP